MPERFPLDRLTRRVVRYFQRRSESYGLRREMVNAHYILNWGGFVNASFTVTDGEKAYHLKLADDEDVLTGLKRWQALNGLLEERYHAPLMLDWIRLRGTGFEGPLFQYVPGHPADLVAQAGLLREVLDLLERLHGDEELAGTLAEDSTPTCAEYFLGLYIDRFDEDLLIVAPDLPPFVSLPLLDWMMGETRELEGLVREEAAFQLPAGAPIHGDLWSSNILVTEDGQWVVIDWDDLALGDPALEYGILLGPLWREGGYTPDDLARLLPPDPALRERFRVCLRAFLLDEVIDPLADWVESGFAPEHQVLVRAEKERKHKAALALYRDLF